MRYRLRLRSLKGQSRKKSFLIIAQTKEDYGFYDSFICEIRKPNVSFYDLMSYLVACFIQYLHNSSSDFAEMFITFERYIEDIV